MIKKIFLKLMAKITVFSLLASMLSPMAVLTAHADDTYVGTVNVRTSHENGTYSIYPIAADEIESNRVVFGGGLGITTHPGLQADPAPGGTGYKIVFGSIGDQYITPETKTFNLVAGAELSFGPNQANPYTTGVYTLKNQAITETVSVNTNIAGGNYSIYPIGVAETQENRLGFGGGLASTDHPLEASDPAIDPTGNGYKIVFGEAPGYETAQRVTFNLVKGTAQSFTGEYTLKNQAILETVSVNTNHANGTYTIYPIGADEVIANRVGLGGGLASTDHLLEASDPAVDPSGIGYKIVFNDMGGEYITPQNITFNLVKGAARNFTGEYTLNNQAVTESVFVNTSIDASINGGTYTIYPIAADEIPANRIGFGEGLAFTEHLLEATNPNIDPNGIGYKIVFDAADGYAETPATITFNLVKGTPRTFTGLYSHTPAATVTVTVLNQKNEAVTDGEWTLLPCSGPNACDESNPIGNGGAGQTFLGVDPGYYKLTVPNTLPEKYGQREFATNSTQIVSNNGTIEFILRYTEKTTPVEHIAIINVSANYDRSGLVNKNDPSFDGAYRMDTEAPVNISAIPSRSVDVRDSYTLTFTEIDNHTTPTELTHNFTGTDQVVSNPANISNLTGGETYNVSALYKTQMANVYIHATGPTGETVDNITVAYGAPNDTQQTIISSANSATAIELNSTKSNTVTCPGTVYATDSKVYKLLSPVTGVHTVASLTANTNHTNLVYTCDYVPEDSNLGALNVTIAGPTGNTFSAPVDVYSGTEAIAASKVTADGYTINNGDSNSWPLEGGMYAVQCGTVAGLINAIPGLQTVEVIENETANITCSYVENVAYVNVETTPVKAPVQITVHGEAARDSHITSELVSGTIYKLSEADRYQVAANTAMNIDVNCLPTVDPTGAQALKAPAAATVNGVNITADSEQLLHQCVYTNATKQVSITIDTVNVQDSAILVDGIEVRSETTTGPVTVKIATEDAHTISFADRTDFTTPADILIPANSLTENTNYIGLYLANTADTTTLHINSANTVEGKVYLTINGTKALIGTATQAGFDYTVDKNTAADVRFENKNNPANSLDTKYALRVVSDAACTVGQEGNSTTTYQEFYECGAPLPDTLNLTAQYIEHDNAAYFTAITDNASVSGTMTLNINGVAARVFNPGANTATQTFVLDIANETGSLEFESPVTVATVEYSASPASYTLNSTNFPVSPTNTIDNPYQLMSTYLSSVANIEVITVGTPATVTIGSTNKTTAAAGDSVTFNNVNAAVDNTITCGHVDTFKDPSPIFIPANTLTDTNTFACVYIAESVNPTQLTITTAQTNDTNTTSDLSAPITLNIDGTDYNLGYTSGTPTQLKAWVDTNQTNTINYGNLGTYSAPTSTTVNVDPTDEETTKYTGIYVPTVNANYVNINAILGDTLAQSPFSITLAGPGLSIKADGSPVNGVLVDNRNTYTVTFGDDDDAVDPLYNAPAPLSLSSTATGDTELTGNGDTLNIARTYINSANIRYVQINLGPTAVLPTAVVTLTDNTTSTSQTITANNVETIDVTHEYVISFSTVAGYTAPADIAIAANELVAEGLTAVAPKTYDATYSTTAEGTVSILAHVQGQNTALNNVHISINSTEVSVTGSYTAQYTVGDVLTITFEDHNTPTYGTPLSIGVGGNTPVPNVSTATLTVSSNNSDNIIDATYSDTPALDDYVFIIETEDNLGNPLTEDYSITDSSGTRTGTTAGGMQLVYSDLEDFTIGFAAGTGYINTPSDVVFTTSGDITVPNDVHIVEEPTVQTTPATPAVTHNTGDTVTLKRGYTYHVVGVYTPKIQLVKTIESVVAMQNNNQRVNYLITVTRNDTSAGTIDVQIGDTVSSQGSLSGSNGGTLTVVPGTSSCENCQTGYEDITKGHVQMSFGGSNNTRQIRYQMTSNNSTIPANQTSTITNKANARYTDGTDTVDVNSSFDLTLSAAPSTPSGPTGGGGGGGGYTMIKGDMEILVEKFVSTDGVNYKEANEKPLAVIVPENKDTKLHTKVRLTNLGEVTAKNIKFRHLFNPGKSDMEAEDMINLNGAKYNEKFDTINIDQILVGKDVEFKYEVLIHEKGQSDEFATDSVRLIGFKSKLPKSQDGLTYLGIGEETPTYLVAGQLPNWVKEEAKANAEGVVRTGSQAINPFLSVNVSTNKSEAQIGEEVVFTIKLTNTSDKDLTGLTLTHDYDESGLSVIKSIGGRDNGQNVTWKRNILRPGQTAKYQVKSIVKSSAPIDTTIRSLTRTLFNEYDDETQFENTLRIVSGMPSAPVQAYQLAQTGPMSLLLLLLMALASYFGHKAFSRRRYLAMKKEALSL